MRDDAPVHAPAPVEHVDAPILEPTVVPMPSVLGLRPHGIAVTALVWVAVSGILAKLWRAEDLLQESGAMDGFVYLPLGVGAEVLAGALVLALCAGWAGSSRAPGPGVGWPPSLPAPSSSGS